MTDPIVRIAARGDGVSATGVHVAGAVTGDWLDDRGTHLWGAHHQEPPCRHFPECGGCQLQHSDDAAYAGFCSDRVRLALAQHGLETDVRPAYLSPPRSRRRAALKARNLGTKRRLIGFHATKTNAIIDMHECHVLRPELFALVAPLRALLDALPANGNAEIQMTLADQGVDLAIKGWESHGLAAAESLVEFAERNRIARLSIDEGYGAEPRFEPWPVTVTLSGVPVQLPVGAFLQATEDGEAALVEAVREATHGAGRVADLFAGLGTFSFSLDGNVFAAEASRDAVLALKGAAARADRQLTAEHRDLYRRPLQAAELAPFDAVVLDPPRAGAVEQVKALATSSVERTAYVSCNPATFARDAAMLVAGGYRLLWALPVGQFRWSTHVELVAAFAR